MSISLKGYVHTILGVALPSLAVQAWASDGTAGATTTTDANGMWALTGLDSTKIWRVKIIRGTAIIWIDGRAQLQLDKVEVDTSLTTDTIVEHTATSGVTIDGTLFKDGGVASATIMQDYLDKFRDFVTWSSVDGMTLRQVNGGADGNYGARLTEVMLTAGSVLNDYTHLYSTQPYRNLVEAGKVITAQWLIRNVDVVTNNSYIARLDNNLTGYSPAVTNILHFGFYVTAADIFASNASGTAQTSTDTTINLSTGDQWTRLKAVFTVGTDIKFYVNGTLRATHTTNLPAATQDMNLCVGAQTTTGGETHTIFFGSFFLEKTY